jgi:hypothetical protein
MFQERTLADRLQAAPLFPGEISMSKREIAEACAQMGRRQVLKAFAGAVGGVALGACGGGAEAAGVGSTAQLNASNVPNELVISLPAGSQTNYPLQFGRAFRKGDIPGLPHVALDGAPLALQQVDVKTLHDDCSVKFAVISVVVPLLDTRERVLSITNKAVTRAQPAETVANMLTKYDFEAQIGLAVGGRPLAGAPISARAMLSSLSDARLAEETAVSGGGVNSRYWTVGPVCTTVLLCDHTTKRWDVGTNATKAIRPMFHVQFWPSIGKYHVRHILEVADVTKLKDETGLDVTFTTGQAAPVTRLTQTGAYVYAGTFQTRAYWGGTQVPRANVKHGVAYMASTMAMPNFNPSITMNASSVTSYESDWASKGKALGANGYWQKGMAATGGRQDLGLIPKWDVVALYSGAAHMHDIAEKHSEMAGSWRFYLREGDASKTIFGSTLGRGRVVSKLSRPLQWRELTGSLRTGPDGYTVDGTLGSADSWAEDSAHTPGLFWFSYLTTGEAIWHERLQQVAAWSQFIVNSGLAYNSVGNGRASTDLILNGLQSRAYGWQMRNRARAWWASLDGSPEKSLFDQALTDAAAQRAGLYDVPGMLVGNPIRDAWNTNHARWFQDYSTPTPRPNALQYWEGKGPYSSAQFIGSMGSAPDDWGGGAQAPWMRHFISLCLNHAVELGATVVQPLAVWASFQTISIANGPEPRHIADYAVPDIKADGSFYQTLADLYDGWPNNADTDASPPSLPVSSAGGIPGSGAPNTYTVSMDNYAAIATAALAMSSKHPSGNSAWNFIRPWAENTLYYNHDPRYAIIPRN